MQQENTRVSQTRKTDHIDLAFQAREMERDPRFYYEPMLSGHPDQELDPIEFLGKKLKAPFLVSSMTGGADKAFGINRLLARACADHGLAMGLGSCRSILFEDTRFDDFNLRPLLGDQPLLANIGVAQAIELAQTNDLDALNRLVDRLQADALILHVNPLQEWLQPEGDRYFRSPLDLIHEILDVLRFPLVVKEVGQGFGPASMKALLELPLAALDFAAHGGTNFAKLEVLRTKAGLQAADAGLMYVGHSAEEMVGFANDAVAELGDRRKCPMVIISGGVKDFLDAHYLMSKCQIPAIVGQASAFLQHALNGEEALDAYVNSQINGLRLSRAMLTVKPIEKTH